MVKTKYQFFSGKDNFKGYGYLYTERQRNIECGFKQTINKEIKQNGIISIFVIDFVEETF